MPIHASDRIGITQDKYRFFQMRTRAMTLCMKIIDFWPCLKLPQIDYQSFEKQSMCADLTPNWYRFLTKKLEKLLFSVSAILYVVDFRLFRAQTRNREGRKTNRVHDLPSIFLQCTGKVQFCMHDDSSHLPFIERYAKRDMPKSV